MPRALPGPRAPASLPRRPGASSGRSFAPLPSQLLLWALALTGAFIGAVTSREFRFRMPSKPAKSFWQGMLVMNLALLAGGCSTRLLLSTSAGDLLGLTGFGAMVVGVVLATFWLRSRALR